MIFVTKNRSLFLAVFFVLLFLYATALSSYAITIDGVDRRIEWAGSSCCCIIDNGDKSNCDVTYATVKTLVDDDDNRLFIMVTCKTKEGAADENLLGAEFFINEADRLFASYDGLSSEFDPYYYSLESVFRYDEETKIICGEICLGIKFGVPETLLLGVRIFDCGGIPSNLYTVTIRNAADSLNNDDEDDDEKEKSNKTSKSSSKTKASTLTTTKKVTTTKAVTTKQSTTAPFTTVEYKPVDLFKSKTTVTSAKSTTKKKKNTTTAKARPEKTTVAEKPAESGTILNCEQRDSTVEASDIADAAHFDYPFSADDAVAVVKGELESYKKTSRKKTIGIAAASALLSAAVIDVLVTSVRRQKEASKADSEEDT